MKSKTESGVIREKPATDGIDSRIWKVAAVVFLGPLMTQVDATVVNVSLSTIQQELHTSIDTAQWIISGYLLALALMLPLNAWLVDRLGAKRLYLWCFSAFTLASLLCGAARTIDQLIIARVFQGMAGGMLTPMAQLMMTKVAGRHFARIIGYMAMPVLLAPIFGPVLAGAILKYASWPWLFFINLPIGIAAIALARILLPPDERSELRRPFDLPGFLMISPGIAAVLLGLDSIAHHRGALPLVLGIGLLMAFIWHALRKRETSLIDVTLFKNRIYARSTITMFFSMGASFGAQMLIPLYLISGCKFTPSHAGWMLAPMGLGMMCVYPMIGFLTDRFGCRMVSVSGTLISILGTLPFLWMIHYGLSPVLLVIALFVRGAGQGGISIPALSAGYSAVPKERLALATTATNIMQRLGGPVATTVMAIVLSLSAPVFPPPSEHAFMAAFLTLIVLQLLVLCQASFLPLRIHQGRHGECV